MTITDEDRFAAITNGDPMPEAPAEVALDQGAARDDRGRFAASTEGNTPSVDDAGVDAGAPKEPSPGPVNYDRFKEVNDDRRAQRERADRLEAALLAQSAQPRGAQVQPQLPSDPASMWDDPDKWGGSLIEPIQQQVQETREFYSRMFAEQSHGKEKVNEAYSALDKAISSGQINRETALGQLNKSMDPFGDIMGWFENTAPQRDPDAYKQRIIDEYLSSQQNPGGVPAAPTALPSGKPANVVRIPQSLNRATSAAPSGSAGNAASSEEDRFSRISRM